MKKIRFLLVAVLMSFSFAGSILEAASGFPAEDTWVHSNYEVDVYVSASGLNRYGRASDAALSFDTILL